MTVVKKRMLKSNIHTETERIGKGDFLSIVFHGNSIASLLM